MNSVNKRDQYRRRAQRRQATHWTAYHRSEQALEAAEAELKPLLDGLRAEDPLAIAEARKAIHDLADELPANGLLLTIAFVASCGHLPFEPTN